jgi:hypothetical protein
VNDWLTANQRALEARMARVRGALERALQPDAERLIRLEDIQDDAGMSPPPAIETLCMAFGLSPFERDVLLLCAALELDSRTASLCGDLHGDPAKAYATFQLALGALPDSHWSALSPDRPLRRWRMIEVNTNDSLTRGTLRIDERILHYLLGVHHLDARIAGLLDPLPPPDTLPESQQGVAAQIAGLWLEVKDAPLPRPRLYGGSRETRHQVAAAACRALGLNLYALHAADIPTHAAELEGFARLWEREAILAGAALLIEIDDVAGLAHAVRRLIDTLQGAALVSADVRLSGGVAFEIAPPTRQEQDSLWRAALLQTAPGAPNLNGTLSGALRDLTSQFTLMPTEIAAAAQAAALRAQAGEPLADALWEASRGKTRAHLDQYAQRLRPTATWDDLVLPEAQMRTLREIAIHVRQRLQVYESWGFGARFSAGTGISALFAGPSGTGKTMAAEVLANALRLDLYRIDLSAVVSKYIGETEKNLRALFDAAEYGGAALLFDEADALFGKRSEVKDSHDRYANIEVSYLLQRMETYRGLAILTSNLKNALDPAFLRRIRFIVNFPFPDAPQRAQIWRRAFPPQTPLDRVDADKLARLSVAGGSIRNIALGAAFLAADEGQPVRMKHLLRAAKTECAKIDKTVSEAEIDGWVTHGAD